MKIKMLFMPLFAAAMLPGGLSGENITSPAQAQKTEYQGKTENRRCRQCRPLRRTGCWRRAEDLAFVLQYFPEEKRARMKALSKDDPSAFRHEVRAFFCKEGEKKIREWMELREQYLKIADPAGKKALEEKLRADLTCCFDIWVKFAENRIAATEARLRKMTMRLERLKKAAARGKKNRDKLAEELLRELLDPAKEPSLPPFLLPPASPKHPASAAGKTNLVPAEHPAE